MASAAEAGPLSLDRRRLADVLAVESDGRRDAMAIVGMACRFPGGAGLHAFAQLLDEERSAISHLPPERWPAAGIREEGRPFGPAVLRGGWVEDVDRFDAPFFGIADREAVVMDPQQRWLLELAFEALQDAGIRTREVAGSETGVFLGITSTDYGRLLHRVPGVASGHAATGNATSIAASRIAYHFDLRGPSLVVDTACSSSLVALHLALRSLRAGEVDLALVGGANLVLGPEVGVALEQAGLLSRSGTCRPFSAHADGFLRGEGAAILVLRRLPQALARGDRIYAAVRGSAVNQDGRSVALTAPNGTAQAALLRRALDDARLRPSDVSYVEAFGAGSPVADAIEARALGSVLGRAEDRSQPCLVGCVKANIGHLEGAAGVAAVVKTALALHRRRVPATLGAEASNPEVDFAALGLRLVRERVDLDGSARVVAGVSALAFGGANAHVVLETAPAVARAPAGERSFSVVLGARTEAALSRRAAQLAHWLEKRDDVRLADVASTCALSCNALEQRAAVAAHTLGELCERLWALAAGRRVQGVRRADGVGAGRDAIVLVLPEPGDEAGRAGATDAQLDRTLARASRILERRLETWTHPQAAAIESLVRPGLFQVALCEALCAAGVQPGAIVASGAGYVAAGVAAGSLSLEDAVDLLVERAGATPREPLEEPRPAPAIPLLPTPGRIASLDGWRSALRGDAPAWSEVAGDAIRRARHVVCLGAAAPQCWEPLCRDDAQTLSRVDLCADGAAAGLEAVAVQAFLDGAEIDFRALLGTGADVVPLPPPPWEDLRYFDPAAAAPQKATADAGPPPVDATAALSFYRTRWVPRGRPTSCDLGAASRERSWLVLADGSPHAHAIVAELLRRDVACSRIDLDAERDSAGERGALSRRVRAWLETPGAERRGVLQIHCGHGASAGEEMPALARRGPAVLARVLRGLAWIGDAEPPRLCTVTAGAQPVVDGERLPGLAGATSWGAGRALDYELPGLRALRMDLDAAEAPDVAAARVADEIAQEAGEPEVAWRAGERFVRRVQPVSVSLRPAAAQRLRSDGSYLVTGASGDLGPLIVAWLHRSGAGHVATVARGDVDAEVAALFDRLRSEGASIVHHAVDVGDARAVRALVARIEASGPPLRGVIHMAGIHDDGELAALDDAVLSDVLRAKVEGTLALNEATQHTRLDFFVAFSSLVASLGAPRQGTVAAANAFLDAAMAHRRSLGLVGSSIGWGPWAEVGDDLRPERLDEAGPSAGAGFVRSIPIPEGIACLAAALSESWSHLSVLPQPIEDLLRFYPRAGGLRVFEQVAGDAARSAVTEGVLYARREIATAYRAPESETERVIAGIWRRTLSIDRVGTDDGFFELGGDSVLGSQVLARIGEHYGVEVPQDQAFERFTIAGLAAIVEGRLVDAIERLSDEEAAALLREEERA